ncbi:MAG: DUF1269 domain-containing protein [Tabrizicola sp.]|nr:DUF1269 domain-containing protein [Tabrizicola sp.]
MSDIVVLAYRKQEAALAAGVAMARLQAEAGVSLEDIVVVTRDEADSVNVNHLIDRSSGRTLAGGEWGMVIGMLFLANDAKHAKGGSLAARFLEAGVEAKFLDEVTRSLEKGGAAVGLRRRFLDLAQIEARLKSLPGNGKLIRTRLSPETEERLMDLQDQIPPEVLAHVQADG